MKAFNAKKKYIREYVKSEKIQYLIEQTEIIFAETDIYICCSYRRDLRTDYGYITKELFEKQKRKIARLLWHKSSVAKTYIYEPQNNRYGKDWLLQLWIDQDVQEWYGGSIVLFKNGGAYDFDRFTWYTRDYFFKIIKKGLHDEFYY